MKGEINIYILASVSFPEGMAGTKRVKNYATAFSRLGFPVSVVTFSSSSSSSSSGIWGDKIDIGGESVTHYSLSWRRLLSWKNLLKSNSGEGLLLVYSGLSIQNILFSIIARWFGIKVVVDYVEDFRHHQENVGLIRKLKIQSILILERFLSFFVDGVIVISTYLESKFRALYSDEFPVILVPISAQITESPSYIGVKREKGQELSLLYSGSFGNKDGLHLVADAVKALYDEGVPVKLRLTGSQDNYRNILFFENHPAFEFLGFLSEADLLQRQSEANVLLMSRVDSLQNVASFPFKLGEYLASGNTVIATKVGDVSKYLDNGVDAILIESDSVFSLKEAIKWVYLNPAEAAAIGRRGREKCEQVFGIQNVQEKLLVLLGQVGLSAEENIEK